MNSRKLFHVLRVAFAVTPEQLTSKTKRGSVALARQVGMWLCREHGDTYQTAAAVFLRHDHSTAVHACLKIDAMRQRDPEFAQITDWCRRALSQGWTELQPWKAMLEEWRKNLPQVIDGQDPHMEAYKMAHMRGH